MGRVKTKPVKRITNELVANYFDEFTENFEDNKAVVDRHVTVQSKKLRNIIAGYATRQVKSRESI
ncbi:MAG: 30S ribosomal protein S17e [archaeon]